MHLVALSTIIAKSALTVLVFIVIKNDADLLLIPILEIIGNFICISVNLYCFTTLKVNIAFTDLRLWYTDLRESLIYFLSNFATTILGSFTTVIVGFYMAMSSVAI